MTNKKYAHIEQIIAKIDNDFNLDQTDYVPRIAAWVIEALSILKCTKFEYTTKKIEIKNRIGYLPTDVDFDTVKIYCKKGCEISNINDEIGCRCNPVLWEVIDNKTVGRDEQIAIPDNSSYPVEEYTVVSKAKPAIKLSYYVAIDKNKFELNFDTDYVFIKYKTVTTYYSDVYNCDLPVIPNNGLLLDAITYYCMYKILCRGYKHPVFNLSASQYGTNPYFMWQQLKEEAKRSVMFDEQGEVVDDKGEFRKSFFNFTFNPKD